MEFRPIGIVVQQLQCHFSNKNKTKHTGTKITNINISTEIKKKIFFECTKIIKIIKKNIYI